MVPVELYGAARMLRSVGVDQLSIPDRLAALEPDQTANYTRLYQRQSALVSLVVDDASFAERFLHRRGWAARLDDELTRQLPFDDDGALPLRTSGDVPVDDVARLTALVGSASVPLVRTMAAVALVRLARADRDALDLARSALWGSDPTLAEAAAMACAHWRPQHGGLDLPGSRELLEVLGRSEPSDAVLLARATLGDTVELSAALLGSVDGDDAFAVALVTGRVDELAAALSVPERRFAAAAALARHGAVGPLAGRLESLDDDQLWTVLDGLDQLNRPVSALRADLWAVTRQGEGSQRYVAAKLLLRDRRPGDALTLLGEDPTDSDVIQYALQRAELTGRELDDFAAALVACGRFAEYQYGVSELADSGRLGDDFVPSQWPTVHDDERRHGLLRFAERQLGARGDDALHRFVLSVVFGDYPAAVRSEAWWVLRRWYGTQTYAWTGPLVLDAAAVQKWFGEVARFLDRLVAFLEDPDGSGDLTLGEKVADLLRYTSADSVAGLTSHQPAFDRFVAALERLLDGASLPLLLASAVVRFLELLAESPGWSERVLATLDRHGAGDGEAAFDAKEAARRIRERTG